MKVLAFRHVPFEDVGHIRPVLEARGVAVEGVDLYRPGSAAPDITTADALIFMGGPMSVNDGLPYLEAEMSLIREAVGRGQPVFGVCLGAQLIAKALGARVQPNPQKEIGWFDIELTEAAREDAVFGGLEATVKIFQWHGETFDLPEGATLLATSVACRNQAFRLGATTYGIQFHPEVTPDMISDWCRQDANCGDVCELSAPIDPHAHERHLEELAAVIFSRWITVR
jgi:GMP synthase-like glutamine amidotransferase